MFVVTYNIGNRMEYVVQLLDHDMRGKTPQKINVHSVVNMAKYVHHVFSE